MKQQKGFTLIELAIVATIISLLVAIVIPNFLNAQVRAKVAAAEADMAMLAVGVEDYYSDNQQYPSTEAGFFALTTPICYFRSLPTDPFGDKDQRVAKTILFRYRNLTEVQEGGLSIYYDFYTRSAEYAVWSNGPDFTDDYSSEEDLGKPYLYDPTNGTRSTGDIMLVGPR